jgi:excisionase family DNA binding protein
MTALERLLTAREVSERLAVSPETVLRWTRRGELPGLRLPSGAIRYRPADLEEWLGVRSTIGSDGREASVSPNAERLARPRSSISPVTERHEGGEHAG